MNSKVAKRGAHTQAITETEGYRQIQGMDEQEKDRKQKKWEKIYNLVDYEITKMKAAMGERGSEREGEHRLKLRRNN